MQTTLLSFLGEKELYPTIIYLNFIDNIYNVEYLNNIPSNSDYLGKIKWNYSKNDLNIYINKKLLNSNLYNFESKYTTKNVSLLKSQLQKSIRRMNTNLSINICYQMINLDFNELLRRLLIITLEDVFLNQYFGILTWMMVAFSAKKWNPTNKDINWILNYVNYLCSISYRDKYYKIDTVHKSCDIDDKLYSSLIFSLELRKSYGGMKGDIKMLNWFINEWNIRFKSNSEHTDFIKKNMKVVNILNENIVLVKPSEMLLEGCDFHNYPDIINIIYSNNLQFNKEQIKEAIWQYSSKINFRNYIDNNIKDKPNDDYYDIWNEIKDLKNKLCKEYLIKYTI